MDKRIYTNAFINTLREHLTNDAFRFITYPKFVFLCGKYIESDEDYALSNRGVTESFISSTNNDVKIILSERLAKIIDEPDLDLLSFEEFLAELSDAIVLFVESPGSFCELGAFAYTEELFGDKLIIAVDKKYKDNESFIIQGPIKKALNDKTRVIYAPVLDDTVLFSEEFTGEIIARLQEFASTRSNVNKREPNRNEKAVNVQSFVIEILELVRLLEPIPKADLIDIYKAVKGFNNFDFVKRNGKTFKRKITTANILNLLCNTKVISNKDGMLSLLEVRKPGNLMFAFNNTSFNATRSKLLCKRYQHKWNL